MYHQTFAGSLPGIIKGKVSYSNVIQHRRHTQSPQTVDTAHHYIAEAREFLKGYSQFKEIFQIRKIKGYSQIDRLKG